MSKLISINVGLPREIQWQGKMVRTAIWKQPVAKRVFARRLNLDGDGQADLAGHGGEQRAVMVYQLEAYRHWESHLARNDFAYGQFGENFTVDGLADNEVCIGDRYRIGNAIFEVTQPRVTCYRLGIRMNNVQMPALVVSHRRPGFYFRVIEEGEVGAGDDIHKISDGPGKISVAEIDSLLYLPNHERSRMAIAVSIPALSPGWRYSLDALLKADEEGFHNGNAGLTSSIPAALAWDGFRLLRVAGLRQETNEVTSVLLDDMSGTPLPPFAPGQHIVLRLVPDKSSHSIVRSYSISGRSISGGYRISVKRGSGPGSRYLIDGMRIGATLETSAPRGDFVLRSGTRPVVLISAGIGVTPFLSMLQVLSSGTFETSREVWWIYGARNGREHPFARESREFLDALPGSHSTIAYSEPDPADRFGDDFDIRGRVDQVTLQSLGLPTEADFYLCGPTGFLMDINRALASMGVPPSSVHQEVFGPANSMQPGGAAQEKIPHPPIGSRGDGPRVSFTRSGLTVPWDNQFKSLLDFAEACDVPVKWSCRSGVCHMCECGLLNGKLRYAPEPLDQPAAGNALICCSTPESEVDLDL
jgi:ferredoxin-NADP reductase/MOSC domain-containing protein YiiM